MFMQMVFSKTGLKLNRIPYDIYYKVFSNIYIYGRVVLTISEVMLFLAGQFFLKKNSSLTISSLKP